MNRIKAPDGVVEIRDVAPCRGHGDYGPRPCRFFSEKNASDEFGVVHYVPSCARLDCDNHIRTVEETK